MKSSLYISILCLLSTTGCMLATQTDERPNVVFILSDDQAWNDYGFMGHPHIDTPHLDKLASESLVYERGYVTAPLCRPSLAGLVSGLHPHQNGIRGNDPIMPKGLDRNSVHLRARMTAPMDDHPSFIRALTESGYATLQTGKWWEGNPVEHGFTDAMTHGDPKRKGRHGDVGLKIGRDTFQPYYDFVDRAVDAKQPFFVWYGVFLPHTPHNAPKRLQDKYTKVAPNQSTAKYWANVEWFDETCGTLLEYLETKGIAENTIIVYICDNGWVPDPKKPQRYQRSKRDPFEAGIRTPIMVHHKGKVTAYHDTETLASAIDIGPTILRACSVEVPAKMTGLDLRDTAALVERNQVFVEAYEHDSNLDQLADLDNGLNARVVINGWDKLIAWSDRTELYELKQDPDDRKDLSKTQPEKVQTLNAIIDNWLKATSSQD
ncbi:MAG: sulfatase-like hydrolase/transferase [Lentimonas sp.]